jgi:hypothetical protein
MESGRSDRNSSFHNPAGIVNIPLKKIFSRAFFSQEQEILKKCF